MFDYPLPLPANTQYDRFEIDPTATTEEILVATHKLTSDLQQQQRQLEKQKLRKRAQELERMVEEINAMPLSKPDKRLAYDRSTPPLDLLKLVDCSYDDLSDNRTILVLLRREISAFLAEQGEAVFHPSDLTRTDFVSDFDPIPFLDGER